ncbi:SDR family oxidoreductase [Sphingobacterium sp. Mn56C]|uniref:SDR family oxidoreductase n=1 Tax=Sphingobacterium sp. Mn56C TaxID=3395261 RepID=UPI003BC397AE
MMRILITGSNGFVSQKFCEQFKAENRPGALLGVSKSTNRNPNLKSTEFQQIDLSDFEALNRLLVTFKPTHILHTAAVTAVETCEQRPERAQQLNVDLTAFLGAYAKEQGCHLTFISTDFVFDGIAGPYLETDPTNPKNVYGSTKVEAEQRLLALGGSMAILRTILLYGAVADLQRSNLVLWAKKQLEANLPIDVVSDQWRMPTWVDDLAQACWLSMVQRAEGIFHISGNEMLSIEEAVRQVADFWNLDKTQITPISSAQIGQADNRPQRTGFSIEKAKKVLGYNPTAFVVSLQEIDKQLKAYLQ